MEHEKIKTTLKVNDEWHSTQAPYGRPLLDFLRGDLGLKGTKEGCREGDCGACAVLVGRPLAPAARTGHASGRKGRDSGAATARGAACDIVRYRAMPSCLLALGDVDGCHVLTIEGLASGSTDGLTPVMRAFIEENASQCGFCTPGFIIALSSWLAEPGVPDIGGAMMAIDGNLCRCTGYGAIRRAAERLVREFGRLPAESGERLKALVESHVLPESVLAFPEELSRRRSEKLPGAAVEASDTGVEASTVIGTSTVIGGGTDYYVRNSDPADNFAPSFLSRIPELAEISEVQAEGRQWVEIGAAVTARDFFASPLVRRAIPGIQAYETDFASTLIRNLATVGGNIANASPVGDLTCMLLGAGASLVVGAPPEGPDGEPPKAPRLLPLERFFLGYKKIDLVGKEIILAVRVPAEGAFFSFEKIAKRRQLDIASVNTAMSFREEEGKFAGVRVSAGGIAPTPVLLANTARVMEGAPRNQSPASLAALARTLSEAAMGEIEPISDVRGTREYRRAMLGKLIVAHFLRFFGDEGIGKELFP